MVPEWWNGSHARGIYGLVIAADRMSHADAFWDYAAPDGARNGLVRQVYRQAASTGLASWRAGAEFSVGRVRRRRVATNVAAIRGRRGLGKGHVKALLYSDNGMF